MTYTQDTTTATDAKSRYIHLSISKLYYSAPEASWAQGWHNLQQSATLPPPANAKHHVIKLKMSLGESRDSGVMCKILENYAHHF